MSRLFALFLICFAASCGLCSAEQKRSNAAEQISRFKRSAEKLQNRTDIDESFSLEGEPREAVEKLTSIQNTNSTQIATAPSVTQPASVETLNTGRSQVTSTGTLPPGRSVEVSSKSLPNGRRPSASSRTFTNNRPTVPPRTFPPRRPLPLVPRTLPPYIRPRPRIGVQRTFPSRRPGVLPVQRRFFPTRRTPLSRLRPPLPTPRRILPRPVRITSLRNANTSAGRQLSKRPTLPRPFRNPLPINRKTSLPEPGFRPRRILPSPRSFINSLRSRRVLPTPSRRQIKFIHVAESSPNRNYDGTVIGCPTFNGHFNTINMTRDGFFGVIRFSPLKESMTKGWLMKMKFSIPLKDVASNSLNKVECGAKSREYCFVPNNPVEAVEKNSEFKAFIVGNFSGLRVSRLRARVEVMGICSGPAFEVEATKSSLALRDFNNDQLEIKEDEKNEAKGKSPPQPQRCNVESPNGGEARGGNTMPTWNKTSSEDKIDYIELLHKSILFYEAQRSGSLPADNRIPWRGDADLKDGCSIQSDLTGGWYDAGRNVKSTPRIAFSVTLLAWGAIDYRDAYVKAGEMENVLNQIRWATDYLMKCKISPNSLVVQIGNSASSSMEWNRPEQMESSSRIVKIADPSKSAPDVAGEVAASLAVASILFNETDANYAAKCLEVAQELYEFAQPNGKRYKFNSPNSAAWYGVNHNMKEELAWASVWLYKATGEEEYLTNALNLFGNIGHGSYLFSMKQKSRAIAILLAEESRNNLHMRLAEQYVDWFSARASTNNKRLLYLSSKGSNMYTANAAFLALHASRKFGSADEKNQTQKYAEELMATLVGVRGQGYVVGVGNNSPKQPHHWGSMCPTPPSSCSRSTMFQNQENPHVLYGALVSGIDRIGRYSDQRSDSLHNGVSIEYNAGFQGLAAGIAQLRSQA